MRYNIINDRLFFIFKQFYLLKFTYNHELISITVDDLLIRFL